MNISQMFNKMSRKNTFWNKIKCYVTLHTVSVMFSHVFLAVRIENVKVQREFLKRFDPLPPSWFCFLASALNVYDVICAHRTIVVLHQSTARATENRCFRIALAVLCCYTLIVCALLLQVEHTDTFHLMCWNYKALTSPHHLLGKIK